MTDIKLSQYQYLIDANDWSRIKDCIKGKLLTTIFIIIGANLSKHHTER